MHDRAELHENDRFLHQETATIGAKLERWDQYAPLAVRHLIDWLRESPEELLAIARGRHVWGHYRYGDRNYAEYDSDRLLAEAAEELGDGINYVARKLYLEDQEHRPPSTAVRRCIP